MKRDILAQISGLLFILGISLSGCGKDQENGTEEDGASVKVTLSGVAEEESSTKTEESSSKQIIHFHEGANIASTVIEGETPKKKTVQALPNGTTYRVIAYKNSVSTSNWVASKQFTVGTATDNIFTFSSGGSYIFVCYSFSNTSNLPFDGSTGTLLSNVSGDVDLLYKQIPLAITNGTGATQNVLSIVLAHEFSRMKVIFNSEIGNITALSNLSFSPHYASANLDLASPTALTYNGSPTAKNFSIPTTLGSTSVETSYSLFSLPSSSGTLTIGSITVNGATRNNISLNYNIAPGKSYTISLNLTGLTAYGLTWSSGNLAYNSTTGTYSFAAADGFGDYWFLNYLKPKKLDGSNQSAASNINGSSGDPCKKVAPINTWRLPTKGELTNSLTATDANGATTNYLPLRYLADHYNSSSNSTNPGMFLGTQTDPGSSRANYVFYPYAGIYYNNNINSAINTGGYYLTSDGYYLQIGNIWTYQFNPNATDNAASIRCIKPAN